MIDVEEGRSYVASAHLKDVNPDEWGSGGGAGETATQPDSAPMLLDVKAWRAGDPSNKVAWIPGQAGNFIEIPDVNLLDTVQASFDNVGFSGTIQPDDRYEIWGSGGGTGAGAPGTASPFLVDLGQYGADRALWLPGAASNYTSVLSNPALNITEDIDLRVKVAAKTLRPSGNVVFINKDGAAVDTRAYQFFMVSGGNLALAWSPNGTNASHVQRESTVALPSDRSVRWLRATLDVDNGASGHDVKFFTSTDGVTWTQLGATVTTAGVTSIAAQNTPLQVGIWANLTAGMFAGVVLRAQVREGIDGTIVYDEDFSAARWDGVVAATHPAILPSRHTAFARGSVAYLDGVEVASGTPRYPYGRNLMSLNHSTVNTLVDSWGGYQGNTTLSASAEQAYHGDTSLRMEAQAAGNLSARSNGPGGSALAHPVVAGRTYTASGFFRAGSVGRNVQVTLVWRDAAGNYVAANGGTQVGDGTGGWTRATVTATAPANAVACFVALTVYSAATGEVHYFDGAQLEEASAATPWRPGGPRAVLIEEGTTNLLTANQASLETDATGWTAARCTLTRSVTRAWHGAASLRMEGTGEADPVPFLDPRVAGSAGTVYTGSFYVWNELHPTFARMLFFDAGGATLGYADSVQVPAAARWQRVAVRATAPGNTATVRLDLRLGGAPVLNVGQFVYMDGAQVEAKSYATSWHPGGATRSAERLDPPVAAVIPTAGSIEVDVDLRYTPDTNERVFEVKRSTGDNGFLVYYAATTDDWRLHLVNDAGATTVTAAAVGAAALGQVHRFAAVWDAAGGVRFFIDGVQRGVTLAHSALPTGFANFGIGHSPSYPGEEILNNPVLGVRVSDRARTDVELADWTAPLTADEGTTYLNTFDGDLQGEWGATTTVNRTTTTASAEIVNRNTLAFTSSEFLTLTDRAELQFGANNFEVVAGLQSRYRGSGSGFNPSGVIGRLDSPFGANPTWGLLNSWNSGEDHIFLSDGTTDSHNSKPWNTAANSGVWGVLSGRRESGASILSRDGVDAAPVDVSTVGSVDGTSAIRVGSPGNYGMRGLISWLAVFRRVLTATERSALAAWDGTVATEPVWLRPLAVFYINADDPLVRQSYENNEVLNLGTAVYGELGWQVVQGDASLTRDVGRIAPVVGSMVMRWDILTGNVGDVRRIGSYPVGPVTPGQTYSGSVAVTNGVFTNNTFTVRAELVWYDAAEGEIGRTAQSSISMQPNVWTRISQSGVAPTGAAKVAIELQVTSDPSWAYDIDAVTIRQGADGGYVPSLRVRHDLDIRLLHAPKHKDSPGSEYQGLISKDAGAGSTERSWYVRYNPSGGVQMAAYNVFTAWGAIPTFADRRPAWLRATLDIDPGVYTTYESEDGITWTQFHSDASFAAGQLAVNTLPVIIGDSTFGPFVGAVLAASIRDGIDGPVLLDLDIADWPDGSGVYEMPNGLVAEIVRAGTASAELVDRPVTGFAGTEWLSVSSRDSLNVENKDDDFAFAAGWFSRSNGAAVIGGKQQDAFAPSAPGWSMYNALRFRVNDGVTEPPTVVGTAPDVTDYAVSYGEQRGRTLNLYLNGSLIGSGTSENTTGSFETPHHLALGRNGPQGSGWAKMLAQWWAFFQRALTATEQADLAAWAGSVATEPTWIRDAATFYWNADDGAAAAAYANSNLVLNLASSAANSNAIIRMEWFDDANILLRTDESLTFLTQKGAWIRPELTAVSPTDAAKVRISVLLADAGAGQEFFIDAVMLEFGDVAGPYFDGANFGADWLWTGDPDASSSRYYPGRADRNVRLRELLPEFLPLNQDFIITYQE